MSDRRQITFSSNKPVLKAVVWMGKDVVTVTGGYGGWEMRARPRRQALTTFSGRDPFQMDVPILLDGWMDQKSVQPEFTALERMSLPPAPYDEPPLVKVAGPLPHIDLTWVINGIKWGASMRNEAGTLMRQEAVISLLHYVAEDRVNVRGSAAKARENASGSKNSPGGSAGPGIYTVKQGDTLSGIAAKLLGDYKRWPEIAKLNGIRDPKTIKVGQKLRIPAK